jgi:citrate lyase alpha subunit
LEEEIVSPSRDKEVQKRASRKWYLNNKEKASKASRSNKWAVREKWTQYKATKSCFRCGFSHPAVIDFHHVIKEGKRSVNKLLSKHNSLKAAIREAEEKCIPLCSNCHRILHWTEHKRGVKKRRKKSGD